MSTELTWRKAIDKILGASTTPLHYNEITEKIISEGLRQNLGATPSATVNAQISASIKHAGAKSPYIRLGKGIFSLAKKNEVVLITTKPKLTPEILESEESEEQYEIVTSFGMFWRKDAVEWNMECNPKITRNATNWSYSSRFQ